MIVSYNIRLERIGGVRPWQAEVDLRFSGFHAPLADVRAFTRAGAARKALAKVDRDWPHQSLTRPTVRWHG